MENESKALDTNVNVIKVNETNFALTTFDNPYDPFEDFKEWFMFDVEKGYNSCGLLARIANVNDSMSEHETNIEVEKAIDQIIKYDFTNNYRKLKREIVNEVEVVD